MKQIALLLLLLTAAATAQAQTCKQALPTDPLQVTLVWTAPTTLSNGQPIASTDVLTYNIYQGTSASSLVKILSGITTLTDTITSGLSANTTYYYEVSASDVNGEGATSNVGCKSFPKATPSAPSLTSVN